jgi:hypothetical protein
MVTVTFVEKESVSSSGGSAARYPTAWKHAVESYRASE